MKLVAVSLVLFAGLAASLSGCVVDAGDTADQTDDLSAVSRSYVTVRRDACKPTSTACGFWVHDVNRAAKERFVTGLDFTGSGLSDHDLAILKAAPPQELVLRGKLGVADAKGAQSFIVAEAYVGMPGQEPAAGAVFYTAADRNPTHECFAAPCNNVIASKLNATAKTEVTSYSVASASAAFVDQEWLTDRVENHGAIVAASVTKGHHYQAGDESVLDASQVYIRLPFAVNPCGKPAVQHCSSGMVPTFQRGLDRCTGFDSCVKPTACPHYLPACEPGYTLTSLSAAPGGCQAYTCDPSFLFQ